MILEEAKKIARIFWANAAPMGDSIRAATALKKMGLSCVKQGLIKAPAQGKVFVKAPFSTPRVITNPLNLKNQLISILSGLRK